MPTESDMIAYVMEAEPELLPLLPHVLADFEELGADAEQIAEVVQTLPLPAKARILDLGSGKGATALEIARQTPHQVLGVDLFAPFVAHAQEQAAQAGLADRCTFKQGDILKLVGQLDVADVVVFAALGDVLGPLDTTMGILRQFVRPGGYLLIFDDYIRADGTNDFPGYEGYAGYEATRQRLQAHGDVIVQEHADPLEDLMVHNAAEHTAIQRRAESLAEKHPEAKALLLAYAEEQHRICAYMEANVVPVLWVLERSSA